MAKVLKKYHISFTPEFVALVDRFLKSQNKGTKRRLIKRIKAFKSKAILWAIVVKDESPVNHYSEINKSFEDSKNLFRSLKDQ